ncbi:hypothetical protein [Chlamydia sp.]|uniref:hypothetical protein n=1 Tax=Chlamydia sp. TaxID=35827 RepID=UPI0025BBFF4C|nr:hypothetical protein [Chlamydia sp.]MBQ8498469.1 hypothetical protein [Chlamydia sp.]
MLKILFHSMTLLGHLLSTPIYIVGDACGKDRDEYKNPPLTAFSVESQFLQIGNADFKTLPSQSLGYRQADTLFFATLPVTDMSGFLLSARYLGAEVLWKSSKKLQNTDPQALGYLAFQDKSFYQYVTLSAGAYTLALNNWQWSVLFSGIVDPESMEIGSGLYQFILSSKYHTSDVFSLVMGVINEVGLHDKQAWPLLGFSYKPEDRLTINCIYPVNFSAEYQCTSVCDLGVAYRLTRLRKKFPKNSLKTSEGIFEYSGREIEGNIKLIFWPGQSLKLFGGYSLGNDISLANPRNEDEKTYKFGSSLFFGGSANLHF